MSNTLFITNVTIVNENADPFKGDVFIEDGRIKKVGVGLCEKAYTTIDGSGQNWLLLPGYIDTHIHGAAGYDTMDSTEEALRGIASFLVKEGVTAFLATTMTQSVEAIEKALINVGRYRRQDGEAEILGVHVEGPFISRRRAGAQPIQYIIPPSPYYVQRWQALSNHLIKNMTIAPEVEGGLQLIRELENLGIVASIGHSDATFEEVEQAISNGITKATHLYNQMRPFHHRDPGVVGGVLLDERVKVELIVDFVHCHPKAVDLVYRLKGASDIILITDAMRAKGLRYGNYDLGGQNVSVTEEGAHLSNGALAGSVLSMERAVKNMRAVTGCSLQELVAMSSTNAAKQMKLARKGQIAEGFDADFVLLDQKLNVQKTICHGKVVYER
ncbi:N-acetylglucosamine-6-phosphate deacetylase [Lysinibacillus sp. 54212]|uniref:N-acetylglucosamine-6-phosphate deacetylase n=1 Tax=Lysinibacillus sp. 54212 TaxID=3119829 RepID=UPI002FC8334B